MAETNVKTLQTRIALKYDTYANWTDEAKGANLVLLKGEIGICAIENKAQGAQTAPTVLFKVGDGEHKFHELNWASALAADVYSWAKAETVELVVDTETVDDKEVETGRRLVFKTGETEVHSIDLSEFATDAEVKTVTDALASRLSAVEAALGTDSGTGDSVSSRLETAESALEVLTGDADTEGSVANAIKVANEHADAAVEAAVGNYVEEGVEGEDGYKAASGLRKEIADAQAAANGYTDGKVSVLEAADAELVKEDERLAGLIEDEADAREEADKAITDMIGTGFAATEGNTVAEKVAAAQKAADDAQADVDALTAADGAVTKNTADIAELKQDLADEVKAREDGDKALDERLVKVETFFAGAYDENGRALNEALDTLVEIQDYLDGDGDAAGTLVDKVAQNASDIADLQATLAKDGDFEKRVAAIEASASANAGDITSLQALTAGEWEGTIKEAVDAAMAQANKGVEDAKNAQDAADKAQDEVDALEEVVATLREEYDVTKALATTNEAAIAELVGRMDGAETDIDDLQAIVVSGADSNENLGKEIDAIDAIVKDAVKGNEALQTELSRVAGLVDDEKTGLAATKKIADDAASDVAEIKADYLKAADVYIFNCGSATEVVHVAPAAE